MLLSAVSLPSLASAEKEYAVLFTVQGGISNGLESSNLDNTDNIFSFEDGQVYTENEVNNFSNEATTQSQSSEVLYKDVVLHLDFFDILEDYSKSFVLQHCSEVDIQHGVDLTQQNVICDGVSYSYRVNGKSIEVVRGEEVALQLDLDSNSFMLNGQLHPITEQ